MKVTSKLTEMPQLARAEDRLDSWKEIASYLRRGVRTVRRWEKEEGLPVRRHLHQRLGTVYAYKSEVDAWWDARRVRLEHVKEEPEADAPAAKRRGTRVTVVAAVAVMGLAVAAYLLWRPAPIEAPARLMMAVLPFENLSGDPDQEYFSDGLTEEMITALGRLHPGRLGVIARTSTIPYKAAGKNVAQIADELRVDYLLEGSVRQEGGRVRVTAQLIRASDQTHLWAQNYDRELGNILDMQLEVARAVAAEIHLQLAENSQGAPDAGSRIRSEAHEAYLRGRYFLDRRTPEAVLAARRWFERATSVQPDYARAWVGLADAQILAVSYANAPPEPAMREARESVLKALALDSRLPEAHAWMGVIQTEYDWDWAGAEQSLRRAVELDPNFAYAHKLYAEYLSYVGRGDDAVAEARLAQQLDPLSVLTNSMVGIALYRARRYDEAVRELNATIKLNPSHPLPYLPLGLAYSQLGRSQEAAAALERTLSLTADNSEMIAQLGYVRARAGQAAQARTLLEELTRRSGEQYVSPFHFAIVYTGLGETQHALEWLEKGYQQRDWLMCVVKTDPIFDPLQREPPFQALLRRMNFPE